MEHTEEADTKGSVSPPPADTTEAAAETESDVVERDRYSREIKAGLHPLKVSSFHIILSVAFAFPRKN